MNFIDRIIDNIDSLFSWFSSGMKQSVDTYCDLETAEDTHTLVTRDGSLVSIISIRGVMKLVGPEEFETIHAGLCRAFGVALSKPGHAVQVYFNYDRGFAADEIEEKLRPAKETAKRLQLELNDLFAERVKHISSYCAKEDVYFVLWTRPGVLSKDQQKKAMKEKMAFIKEKKLPPFKNSQNIMASFDDIRNTHDSFVRSTMNDLKSLNVHAELLEVHDAVKASRMSADPDFTGKDWRAVLPGDKIPMRALSKMAKDDLSGLLWPPLYKQILPRDAENLDLRSVRVGDKIYANIFIELFPQEIQTFVALFSRTIPTQIPWRVSFLLEGGGMEVLRFKAAIAGILSWTSSHNKLIAKAAKNLREDNVSSDESMVKLRVAFATWAPEGEERLLKTRVAELAKAVEGWGQCDVSEVSGDAFGGVVSSMLGVTTQNVATPSVAPLSDVVTMLPFTRPASSWDHGALMLRSPDGKPWPFQPGSSLQTTWIDLMYARPGSGKSVLSNALNLALCLSAGNRRLPRIAIIDIGPSSSGLISLLREALPQKDKHLVAYHRLRMTPEYSINPFDTQLGSRYPTPQERSFLVNFLTLLATPIGSARPYDGMADMVGLVVDELYKNLADDAKPHIYNVNTETNIDKLLAEIDFVRDDHTTWWEVTDALFNAGFVHEAMIAQRHAVPLLSDAASICRTPAIEDLYGKVTAPTGEPLVLAFARMVSSAVREYPILSRTTQFDIGDSRIVSLDLDEVAKSGGEAADRQTAVMYMLARYVLAKHYYLVEDNVGDMPESYQPYHKERISEIREDAKRIVYDEFHRTAKTAAVRDQVIIDMREGRKWNVQIALLSQSVDDFDKVMIEFATSVYIMEAGPNQAIKNTSEIFGLSETAQIALRTRVHGPRQDGATFLAQFSTKYGTNTQLLTSTIGPIELWAFSTTAEDAALRNKLYAKIGPKEARRVLANLFPSGSVKSLIEAKLAEMKAEAASLIEEEESLGIVDQLLEAILEAYQANPDFRSLPNW